MKYNANRKTYRCYDDGCESALGALGQHADTPGNDHRTEYQETNAKQCNADYERQRSPIAWVQPVRIIEIDQSRTA